MDDEVVFDERCLTEARLSTYGDCDTSSDELKRRRRRRRRTDQRLNIVVVAIIMCGFVVSMLLLSARRPGPHPVHVDEYNVPSYLRINEVQLGQDVSNLEGPLEDDAWCLAATQRSRVVGDTERLEVGDIIGWISAIVYIVSRMPQLRTTLKTRRVEGLSPLLFFFGTL